MTSAGKEFQERLDWTLSHFCNNFQLQYFEDKNLEFQPKTQFKNTLYMWVIYTTYNIKKTISAVISSKSV